MTKSGQFSTNYLKIIKPGTGSLVTLLDWLREAWIVRQYSNLDRILRQNIPSSSRSSFDNEGNLRAADIGITWEGSDTFLHGVRVIGPGAAELPGRHRLSTSTPYQPVREHIVCDMSTLRQPLVRLTCLEIPDAPLHKKDAKATDRRHTYNVSITSR